MTFLIIIVGALGLCEVVIAAFLIVGMAKLCDLHEDQKNTNDMISILAGSIAENRIQIKDLKKEITPQINLTFDDTAFYESPSKEEEIT